MKRLWTGCSAAKPRWVRDSAVWWVLRYSVFRTRTECHSMTHATTRWSAAAVFFFWYFHSELPIYGWVILNSWPLPVRNLLQLAIDNTRSLSRHVQTIHHSFQLPLSHQWWHNPRHWGFSKRSLPPGDMRDFFYLRTINVSLIRKLGCNYHIRVWKMLYNLYILN